MSRKLMLLFLCCALFFTLAAQDDKSYRAERFDVTVDAQPDGSLLVNETVTFKFSGGPFSFVFRELPTDHTDGITEIVAGVDGIPWPRGNGPGEVEISDGNPIEVVWHLPPTANTTQTFTLSYRPLGVVRRGDEADVLDWQALPDEYEYAIDTGEVQFTYPPTAQLTAAPEIISSGGEAWQMVQGDDHTRFTAQSLPPGAPFVARLPFAPGTLITATPEWQTRQAAQNSRAWIWFVAAALILIGGLSVLIRAARPYLRSVPKANSYLYKPPVDLPPASAGYLANQSVTWHHGMATLFDLAGRGFIEIEQIREKTTFRSPDFAATLLERPPNLKLHEEVFLDLLFTDRNGAKQEVVTFSEMGRLITSSTWKEFTHAIEDEATAEGLLDPEAKRRQKQIAIWSGVLMVLGLPLFLAAFLLRDIFGIWPLIAVGAVFLVGFVGFIVSASISPLSSKGLKYASAFEPFRRLLKDAANGKTTLPDPTYFETYLPYAAAYGVAEPWVKRQAKSGFQQLPSYFRALESSGAEMAAFIAVISAASSSGGSASAAAGAAGAGAGAAGGGASGAG